MFCGILKGSGVDVALVARGRRSEFLTAKSSMRCLQQCSLPALPRPRPTDAVRCTGNDSQWSRQRRAWLCHRQVKGSPRSTQSPIAAQPSALAGSQPRSSAQSIQSSTSFCQHSRVQGERKTNCRASHAVALCWDNTTSFTAHEAVHMQVLLASIICTHTLVFTLATQREPVWQPQHQCAAQHQQLTDLAGVMMPAHYKVMCRQFSVMQELFISSHALTQCWAPSSAYAQSHC